MRSLREVLVSIFIFALLFLVETKDTYCRNRFSMNEDWIYCTKFGTARGARIRVKIRAKFLARHSEVPKIEIGVYKDQDFDLIMNRPSNMNCAERKALATDIYQLGVPFEGKWSDYLTGYFINQDFPRIYYFVVMDCEHVTHMTYRMMPKIEVDFNIVNQLAEGEKVDHFSYEEEGTLGLHLTLLFIFTALFGYGIYSWVKFQRNFEVQHSPFFVIILALFFQCGTLFWKVIHLLMYSSNGRGIPFFDIVSLICQMLSEITFSSLLMMIAYGWTINFQNLDIDKNLDIYLPVGSVVIIVHLTLAAMTYIDIDAHHKYHDYSGVQGWVLILLKMGLFLYYLYLIRDQRKSIPKRSQRFYYVFVFFGGVYMLSVPFTILASFLFEPYKRDYLFTLTTNLVQLFSTVLMVQQQSSTQSQYFKASLNSQSVLPSSKLS